MMEITRLNFGAEAKSENRNRGKSIVWSWFRGEMLPRIRIVYERNRADATSLIGEIRAVIDKSAVTLSEIEAMESEIVANNARSQEIEAKCRESEALLQIVDARRRDADAHLQDLTARLQALERQNPEGMNRQQDGE